MNDYYPFTKCLHPRKILNPYTKKNLVVPCGQCEACCNNKDLHYSTLCKLESMSHKYTMFVTLTFADDFIPVFDIVYTDDSILFVDINRESGNILYEMDKTSDNIRYVENYKKRTKCRNGYSFLYKKDAQLFLKRLRKFIYEQTNEKIRYYCTGEYGPTTFRGHLHFLFFFDKRETFESFGKNLHSAWRFGNIDWSQSQGFCANYVAGYLNSNSKLPRFLKARGLSQFRLHSQFLGKKVLELQKEKVYESSFEYFNKRCVPFDGHSKVISPWRSFTAYYFPRCRGYNELSSFQRFKVYTIFNQLSFKYRIYKVSELAKEVCKDLFDVPFPFILKPPFSVCPLSTILELCDYRQYQRIFLEDKEKENRLKFFNQVYSIIRTSYHFLSFVCDNNTLFEQTKKLRIIAEYYKFCDYNSLKQSLEYQSSLDYTNEEDYNQFYYNYIDDKLYKENILYKDYYTKNKKLSSDRVKHKVQNDLNNFFINN